MTTLQRQFGTILIGGGPAGLAVLLAAHRDGRLTEMLHQGLLIVERGSTIGNGQIGNYVINSDSTGDTFVAPLRVGNETALHRILETPLAQRIAAAGPNAVPLSDVGELMVLIGQALHTIIDRYPRSTVLTNCTAESAQLLSDGSWQLAATGESRGSMIFHAGHLIIATGATQPQDRLRQELLAGMPVVERWGNRLMQSGEVIGRGGLARVAEMLEDESHPRVAILGGSTSAMAVAHALLHRLPKIRFSEGGVTLLHRRPLRVYYTSAEEALADGYTEFGPEDLCPITKRVYRLAGLRLDSRELLMQLRGIGGRAPEPRVKLHRLQQEDPEAIRLVDSAHLVVAAFGYKPRALSILNKFGVNIPLFASTAPGAPMVDDQCRVLDSLRRPIPGLFGIGLAAGFVPHGKLGGEPSFIGQANGLWLWQNDVGSIIVNVVLSQESVDSSGPHIVQSPDRNYTVNNSNGERISVVAGTGV